MSGPVLKLLDPRVTLKLLEGHKDTITEAAREREQFYKTRSCPQCGGNHFVKKADLRIMFTQDDPLPRYLLDCQNCGGIFDPHSGLIITTGNLGKAYTPTIPIIGSED